MAPPGSVSAERRSEAAPAEGTPCADEEKPPTVDAFGSLLGSDPAFLSLLETAREASAHDVSILVRGETGTGKNLLSRAIHGASPRRDGPLIVVPCAALREDHEGSELFGLQPDLPIGAIRDRPGLVAAAHGGTLVLDEVGDLPLTDQDRLRRFIDTATEPDVRLITVTHRDLSELADKGRFRPELLYRLRGVVLDLPPLRERQSDIELLLDAFLAELSERYLKELPRLSRGARKVLRRHGWPGNVRELRSFCEQILLTRPAGRLRAEDLPLPMRFPGTPQRDTVVLPPNGICLDDWIQELIRQALALAEGNRSRAARLLGITRDTLNYRLKKYDIKG